MELLVVGVAVGTGEIVASLVGWADLVGWVNWVDWANLVDLLIS